MKIVINFNQLLKKISFFSEKQYSKNKSILIMSEKISQIENYFYNKKKNLIHKWDHYFEIYDRHFKKYKDKDIVH